MLALPLPALGLSWQLAAPWPVQGSPPITPSPQCHEHGGDSRAPGIAGTIPPPYLPISEGQGPGWGHQDMTGHR